MQSKYLVLISGYIGGTSSSSNSVGLGVKTFIVNNSQEIYVGSGLRFQKSTDPNVYVEGNVINVEGNEVSINSTNYSGTGTVNSWKVTTCTLRYGTSSYNDPSAPGFFFPVMASEGALKNTQSIFGDGKTFGSSSVNVGYIKLTNAKGVRDSLRKYAFNGYSATILLSDGTEETYDDIPVYATGTIEQPVVSDTDILFRFRDRMAELSSILNSNKYLGNNILPSGLEGLETDLKDRNKPRLRGYANNFSPPLVNTSLFIYQISDKAIHGIESVKDGGVPLLQGVNRGTEANLLANTPTAGYYDYILNGSGGAYIRIRSAPLHSITVSAYEGSTPSDRTFAKIAYRVLIEDKGYSLSDLSTTDIDSLAISMPYETGFWTDTVATTFKEVLDYLAPSSLAWYYPNNLGVFRFGHISDPSGTPVITFKRFSGLTAAKQNESDIVSLELLASNDQNRGLPCSRVNISFLKNYTIQNDADLGGDKTSPTDSVGGLAVREMLKKEYSTTSYPQEQDPDIIEKWKTPLEMDFIVPVRYREDAQALAQKYFNIYSVFRDRFKLSVNLNKRNIIATSLGSIIKVINPRYGLSSGKLFLVLGSEPDQKNGIITLDIWGAP